MVNPLFLEQREWVMFPKSNEHRSKKNHAFVNPLTLRAIPQKKNQEKWWDYVSEQRTVFDRWSFVGGVCGGGDDGETK